MMGRQVAQSALFYGFRLDDHVPADHLLRRIDGLFNLSFVHDALAASYSPSGRPSIDPELMLWMLWMLLVGYPPSQSRARLFQQSRSVLILAQVMNALRDPPCSPQVSGSDSDGVSPHMDPKTVIVAALAGNPLIAVTKFGARHTAACPPCYRRACTRLSIPAKRCCCSTACARRPSRRRLMWDQRVRYRRIGLPLPSRRYRFDKERRNATG